jgi:hypothetical protein
MPSLPFLPQLSRGNNKGLTMRSYEDIISFHTASLMSNTQIHFPLRKCRYIDKDPFTVLDTERRAHCVLGGIFWSHRMKCDRYTYIHCVHTGFYLSFYINVLMGAGLCGFFHMKKLTDLRVSCNKPGNFH